VGISAARPWRLQPVVTLASTASIRRTPVATILDARITSRDTDAEAQRDPDRPMKRERRRATALPRRIEHRSPVPCSSTRPTNERPVRSPVSFAVPTNQTRTPQARLGRRLDSSRGESPQPINREPSEFVQPTMRDNFHSRKYSRVQRTIKLGFVRGPKAGPRRLDCRESGFESMIP
jgi:hypothetical protein